MIYGRGILSLDFGRTAAIIAWFGVILHLGMASLRRLLIIMGGNLK